jgi:hypothetical protein
MACMLLVQELAEEVDRTPLRPLEPLFLFRVVRVTTSRESVAETWEVDVFPLYTRLGQCLQRVLLQLLRVGKIVLWGKNLYGHFDGVNLGLVEKRWVGGGDGIDERRVGGELEAGPTAVAEAHCGNLTVLLLELLCAVLHLGPANFLAVAPNKGHEVKGFGLLGIGHGVRIYDLAIEAVRSWSVFRAA